MSQFEETVDSDNIECPYCGYSYQPECESYDEDESVDDCGNCGKKFYSRQSFTVDHHARPDCELTGLKSLSDIETLIAQYETIEKLKSALNDEMSGYYCPDADKAKEDYCFRHKVCSECKGKRYLADLLKELTE